MISLIAVSPALFEQPAIIRAHFGGGKRFSLWGPDLRGCICRMGRYSDLGRAFISARAITGERGAQP